MRYAPHETLAAPARPSAHPLRLIAGMVLTVALFLPMAVFYAGVAPELVGADDPDVLMEGTSPGAVLLLLGEFGFLILALAVTLRLVHGRHIVTLFGARGATLQTFRRVCVALVALYLFMSILPAPEAYRLTKNLGFGSWLGWLPLALPLVLVQTSAEELVFRGYLQSQLAARFSHPLVWVGIPSVLFGLIHYDPVLAGGNAWMLSVWAWVFGAAAADLTARTGTLGPAVALHFVNNVFAILVTAPAGDLDGLALYTFPLRLDEAGIAWYVLPMEIGFTLCAWLAARVALRI